MKKIVFDLNGLNKIKTAFQSILDLFIEYMNNKQGNRFLEII
jgi:hypothetical protein